MNLLDLIHRKACAALSGGGLLLLEPSTYEAIRREGERGPCWSSTAHGLFSDRSHLCLEERSWDAASRTTTNRYYIVDAESCEVTRHASTSQAYTDAEFRSLLTECGFAEPEFYPSLTGEVDESQRDLYVLVARKREG